MCDFSDAYFVVNWTITAEDPNDANYDKELALKKKMLHLLLAFQKLIIHSLIT